MTFELSNKCYRLVCKLRGRVLDNPDWGTDFKEERQGVFIKSYIVYLVFVAVLLFYVVISDNTIKNKATLSLSNTDKFLLSLQKSSRRKAA